MTSYYKKNFFNVFSFLPYFSLSFGYPKLDCAQGLSVRKISQPSKKDFESREVKNRHLTIPEIFHASDISDTKLHEPFYPCL